MIKEGYQKFASQWKPILDAYQKLGIRYALEVHPTEIAFDIADLVLIVKEIIFKLFVEIIEVVYVVEQNRDAQMKALLMLEANDIADRLVSILHYNGMPIPSECVVTGVTRHQGMEVAA